MVRVPRERNDAMEVGRTVKKASIRREHFLRLSNIT